MPARHSERLHASLYLPDLAADQSAPSSTPAAIPQIDRTTGASAAPATTTTTPLAPSSRSRQEKGSKDAAPAAGSGSAGSSGLAPDPELTHGIAGASLAPGSQGSQGGLVTEPALNLTNAGRDAAGDAAGEDYQVEGVEGDEAALQREAPGSSLELRCGHLFVKGSADNAMTKVRPCLLRGRPGTCDSTWHSAVTQCYLACTRVFSLGCRPRLQTLHQSKGLAAHSLPMYSCQCTGAIVPQGSQGAPGAVNVHQGSTPTQKVLIHEVDTRVFQRLVWA